MKHSLIFLLVAFLVARAPAAAPADFTEINTATTNFVTVLDKLMKDLPQVDDAAGTAKALDAFAKAMDGLTSAMANFGEKYPEATKGTEPPPEFAAAFTAITQLQTKYVSLPKLLGPLVARFRTTPEVTEAMARFQGAMEHMRKFSKQANGQ